MEDNELYKKIFSRNIGFITEIEQEKLKRSSIAIAGMGGVGGLLAERLIRLGIGHLKILDPEDFEYSNFNRQFGASMVSLGKNKAEQLYIQLKDINPSANIEYSKQRVKTQKDAETFVSGCDIIIDEMEFGFFKESIYLQRAARRIGIFYLLALDIGFGSIVEAFDPNGITLEEYNRMDRDVDLEKSSQPNITLDRICPSIPSYVDFIPNTIIDNLVTAVVKGEWANTVWPTIGIGVGLASILVANEAINIILEKRRIICMPEYIYIDLLDLNLVLATIR